MDMPSNKSIYNRNLALLQSFSYSLLLFNMIMANTTSDWTIFLITWQPEPTLSEQNNT